MKEEVLSLVCVVFQGIINKFLRWSDIGREYINMKKIWYFYLSIISIVLGMTGCEAKENPSILTPTPIIEISKEEMETEQAIFKKREKEVEEVDSKIITKTDGLCEVLEEANDVVTGYNVFNRMASPDDTIGMEGTSLFCVDERTGVVYFVNQGQDKDWFLYRMKEGEIALAVAMPVKQLYPYKDSIYFMVNDYSKYELQGMHSGDIYCYTPSNGAVELVYAAGAIENSYGHKLFVEESGIYFSHEVKAEEQNRIKWFYYYLPFGATEPIQDSKCTVRKGGKDYYLGYLNGKITLFHRVEQEDGTREQIELSVGSACLCVVDEMLYSREKVSISCTNLQTKETIYYDFLEAIKKLQGETVIEADLKDYTVRIMKWFVMTEDALWVTTGQYLYRMDLQSGEITFGTIHYNDKPYIISRLYTDGTQVYGLYSEKQYMTDTKKNLVRLQTDTMDNSRTAIIKAEDLIK